MRGKDYNFKATARKFDILLILEAPRNKNGGVPQTKTTKYNAKNKMISIIGHLLADGLICLCRSEATV